jgi:2-alkenal reductase
MRKILPLIVVATVMMTTMACGFGFNIPNFDFQLPNLEDLPEQIPDIQIGTPGPEATYDPNTTPLPEPEYTREANPEPFEPSTDSDLLSRDQLLVDLYNHVSPGVVLIQTYGTQGALGLGSGFVFDDQGHIVTNYHVVEGADELEVDFPSGFKARGEVVGTDLDSDLAVIRVDAPDNMLFPLALGDSDELSIGESVVAIGNPFGLSNTMTLGIVSAKGRTLESLRQSSTGNFFTAGDIIQTDASINPGNSGGPLLNLQGEVIGINRAIRTTGITDSGDPINSGIGFAISINIVKRVVPYLIEFGQYDYPYLGISATPELSLLQREALGLNRYTGAYVTYVEPNGPADQAGIQAGTRETNVPNLLAGGDLIIGVNDREVLVSPGDEIMLTIVRDGEELEVPLTLGKRP